MDPFSLVLFLTPLLVYMVVISFVRVSGRIYVSTGGKEIAALALAVSGMLIVGPVELFFPMAAATVFGPLVWGILALFYMLCVSLFVIGATPKIIVYGSNADGLLEPLLNAARALDENAQADKGSLQVYLPTSGVHLRIGTSSSLDHASIMAFEDNLSAKFWLLLRTELRNQLGDRKVERKRGLPVLIATVLLASFLLTHWFQTTEEITKGFVAWFWR